jgi:EAL domain
MLTELREAMREELFVHRPPTFDLQTQATTGAKAPIRERRPRRGVVVTEAFIPLAEETGLIVPLGRWGLRTDCAQASAWYVELIGAGLSVKHLGAADWMAMRPFGDVAEIVARHGTDPSMLRLEITETALTCDPQATAARPGQPNDLGAGIAIDDFGSARSDTSVSSRWTRSGSIARSSSRSAVRGGEGTDPHARAARNVTRPRDGRQGSRSRRSCVCSSASTAAAARASCPRGRSRPRRRRIC